MFSNNISQLLSYVQKMILQIKNFRDFLFFSSKIDRQEIAQICQNNHYCCSSIIRSSGQESLQYCLFQEINYHVLQANLLEKFFSDQWLFFTLFCLNLLWNYGCFSLFLNVAH